LPEEGSAGKQGSVFLKSEHFDPESLWRRLDHDRGLLREVVAVFAVEAPQLLARIEEGIRGSSAGEVKRASHKLKGSLLQFSAQAAVAVAQELEEKAENGLVAGAAPLLNRLRHEIDLLREGLNAMVCGPPDAQKVRKGSRRGTIPRE
jgi:HPt (histidine-containing phosphotransfer) domain-containing protein